MAYIVVTEADERVIDALLSEFDPGTYGPLACFSKRMPSSDWAFAVRYMRDELGATVLGCLLARAYLEGFQERGLLSEAGRDEFFHGAFHGTSRDFGLMGEGRVYEDHLRWGGLLRRPTGPARRREARSFRARRVLLHDARRGQRPAHRRSQPMARSGVLMARIRLSGEARRMIRRSDEPERMHFNILVAEVTLRILKAHPEGLWDD